MLLGKLVERRHPEIASVILTEISKSDPSQTDMRKIRTMYREYRRLIHTNKKQSLTQIMYCRRIFIGAILHLYSPGIYHQPTEFCIVKKGLISEIATVLGIAQPWVSKLYKEVIFMEKVYEDFRCKVDATIQLLNQQTKTS